jgi:leukotriene-A4 hydrolase
MPMRKLSLGLALLLFAVAARRRVVPPPSARIAPADIFSAAQPSDIESTHLSLDLTVDFATQTLRGSVVHSVSNHTGTRKFVVDTNGLDIDSITADGVTTTWSFGTPATNGTPLVIDIDSQTTTVRIDYRTRSTAGALRWLTAKQTRDGVMPAMWSSSEPDLARSWIPLQDTPSVRVSYDATVHVPSGEMALMSAANNPTSINEGGIYTFSMPHSIPSYLIALTVARYGFRPLGDRNGVYAEPNLLDDTAYEMQFLPDMFAAAQRVVGTYPFERYDLVFPPKYGGGMENPELNFIGQDAITGNHAAIFPNGIIAHEMSHSWFGDLMTCATWSDLWLNEGFATYFEKRIEEEMSALGQAEAGFYTDRQALEQYLATRPAQRLQILHRTFVGTDRPSFTIIWYQKGEMFLKMLEDTMGRRSFDAFIARYLQLNAYHWVDDVAFGTLLHAMLFQNPDLESRLQIDTWLYQGGLPSNVTAPTSSTMWDRIRVQSDAFHAGRNASQLDRTGWTLLEQLIFLQLINDVLPTRMPELDAAFGFSGMNTPPTLWLIAVARRLNSADRALLDRYLARGTSGSLPVWSTLSSNSSGLSYAIPLFNQVRDFYDTATQRQIELTLHLT